MSGLMEELEELDRGYLEELLALQVQLVKLQAHVKETGGRVLLIFEGRDAAGKGGTIARLLQFLDPRYARSVALTKPNEKEQGQWYFQRYLTHLPSPGEIVCFDRSWYNRAVVEPGLGFCTEAERQRFFEQVVPLERMLVDDGIVLAKFWLSISRKVQQERLDARAHSPLRGWKLSPTDRLAHERFDELTRLKSEMFERTGTKRAPWTIVRGDDKKAARLAVLREVLAIVEHPGQLEPAPSTKLLKRRRG